MDWRLHPGISPLDEEAEVILTGFRVWTLDHLTLIIRVDYTAKESTISSRINKAKYMFNALGFLSAILVYLSPRAGRRICK